MPRLKILIIGANRGIGFELARSLKERGHQVFGTYRPSSKDDPSVQQLHSLSIPTFPADYTLESTLSTLPHLYSSHPLSLPTTSHTSTPPPPSWPLPSPSPTPLPYLDILVNSAGTYLPLDTLPFHAFTSTDLLESFRINTLGPFLTSKYLYPLLTNSPHGGRIVNISSDMSSINDCAGGNLPYRLSKAGLNMLTSCVAAEGSRPGLFESAGEANAAEDVEGVGMAYQGAHAGGASGGGKTLTAISIHPGFVPTAMTGYQGRDDLGKCIEGIVRLVERLCEDEGEGRGSRSGSGSGKEHGHHHHHGWRLRGKAHGHGHHGHGQEEELEAGGLYRWDGTKMAV